MRKNICNTTLVNPFHPYIDSDFLQAFSFTVSMVLKMRI